MPEISGFLHASLLVSDLARARTFYENVLGLTPSSARPEMSFDGVWYEIGAQQIHLLALPNPDPVEGRPAHGGRDRHIALAINDLTVLKQTLDLAGVAYTLSSSGRPALFCRDPDGNAIELIQQVRYSHDYST
ncbi:glyoxalase [Sulfuricella sp. T08]|uniref:Lactoylglutathione lyase-like lyase n=1 Tax=Sulfuricella denitrificans (strain DSM 22764 / NBRC 105220 / skB26) TaxID=1163617 RepID=S6AH84_SULDS|nr:MULTISPECIES: VOC family protein [Sulfuricella]BAN35496.1 lactoylglutathione lyase-like lyase [Sulfuricella denitrificans skB26]GAO35697.1 glyoxalase [Sulfuricella sp. T08]